jgi:uncharacterized membrane protein
MQTRTRAAVVAALVLTVSLVAVPVGAATAQLGGVTIAGDAVVQTDANETYLWQSESFTVNTSFATDNGGVYQFCLEGNNDGNKSQRLACQSQTIKNDTTTPISFRVTNASGLNGKAELTVLATESFNSSGETVNRSSTVYVIQKQGDFDGDRLSNQAEVRQKTDLNSTDTDGDGLQDGPEVQEYNTSPIKVDTDSDGLTDDDEVGARSNATVADTDGDGLLDGNESELGTNATLVDTDGDTLSDGEEVHTYNTDPTKVDSDGDGIPDDEEIKAGTTPNDDDADSDGDGLSDSEEADAGTNASLADTDGDLLPDDTELRLGTDPTDGTTLLVIIAGLGFLAIGLVGSIRLFGPDDLSELLPSGRTNADGSSSPSGVNGNGNGGTADAPGSATSSSVSAESSAATTASGETTPADGDDSTRDVPFDLSDPLTDEDEVLKLLYEADGRLRQSGINNATEWSKSKVSRLLSSMEDDGKIRKITIGRENLVTLADRMPESAESPFEDEAQ